MFRGLVLAIILFPSIGLAQDYQPIASNHVRFFTDGNSSFFDYGIKVDSVRAENGDSIYHNYHQIRVLSPGAYNYCSYKQYSWIGSSVVLKPNGWTHFITEASDTVKINHLAELNDSWLAISLSPDSLVWATVSNVAAETILGLLDNIKTVTFEVRNATGQVIPHNLNGIVIQLSESFGIVQAIDFHHFKNIDRQITLTGAEDLNIGVHRPTVQTVFEDFDVGDELAYEIGYHHSISSPLGTRVSSSFRLVLLRIVARSVSFPFQYTVGRYERQSVTEGDSLSGFYFSYEHYADTIIYTLDQIYKRYDSLVGTRIPGVPYDSTEVNSAGYAYIIDNELQLNTDTISMFSYGSVFGNVDNDGCMSDNSIEYYPWNTKYVEHLGAVGGYRFSSELGVGLTEAFELKYLRRGQDVYGTPLTVSYVLGIDPTQNAQTLPIFPNPISIGSTLNLGDYYSQVDLFDISGKPILSVRNTSVIGTENLSSGIYFVKTESDSGISIQKLIVTD